MSTVAPMSVIPDTSPAAKMAPVGWDALARWGDDAVRLERLAGGVANDVWSVQVNGNRAVGRLGLRRAADLAWETELLVHLDREGLVVPVPIPTTDGARFADGLMVMTHVDGAPPETGPTGAASPTSSVGCIGRRRAGRSGRAGEARPSSCTPTPGRGSTSVRCRLRPWPAAVPRGRASTDGRPVSSTVTSTPATSG